MTRPRVAITMGDPAGVGPEVALKALREPGLYEHCRPVVFGTRAALAREVAARGVELALDPELSRDDAGPGRVLVREVSESIEPPPYGEVSAEGGELAVAAVRAATRAALAGRIDALATAPLNKASMRRAGYAHAGHTELLADLCDGPEVSMLLVGPQLRVAHMTTHIALEEVPSRITAERLETVVRIATELLGRLGISAPRLAVAGLNPHAGEGGLFGEQEQRVLGPAIERLRAAGADVSGPLPGDTVFGAARAGSLRPRDRHVPRPGPHPDQAARRRRRRQRDRRAADHPHIRRPRDRLRHRRPGRGPQCQHASGSAHGRDARRRRRAALDE